MSKPEQFASWPVLPALQAPAEWARMTARLTGAPAPQTQVLA